MAGIQPILQASAEFPVVLGLGCGVPRLGVEVEPHFFFVLPSGEFANGQGVGETPSDEVEDVVLLPMREEGLWTAIPATGLKKREPKGARVFHPPASLGGRLAAFVSSVSIV